MMEEMFHSFVDRQCRVRKQNTNLTWATMREQNESEEGNEAEVTEENISCKSCEANKNTDLAHFFTNSFVLWMCCTYF